VDDIQRFLQLEIESDGAAGKRDSSFEFVHGGYGGEFEAGDGGLQLGFDQPGEACER
jgi:hypothetical protein